MSDLEHYKAGSGRLEPIWTLEVQTLPEDTDRILDHVLTVHPLSFGRYQRNASVSAVGAEIAQRQTGTRGDLLSDTYEAGETHPMVELKISIERDLDILAKVMDAIIYAHKYEEPVIFVREDWASRASYDPRNDNPNSWWNDGNSLPNRLE